MRLGALRSLDMRDYRSDELALELHHRPETGTPLKNGTSGERMVALDERLRQLLDEYIEGPRESVQDEHNRVPMVTTANGRPALSTFRETVYRLTRPCEFGWECPHDRDPETCEATDGDRASTCPSSRTPHDLRSGAITAHLLEDVPVEIVSERMDVSQDVLNRQYDRRSKLEKMRQRRWFLRGK